MQCIGPVQGATNDAYASVLCVQKATFDISISCFDMHGSEAIRPKLQVSFRLGYNENTTKYRCWSRQSLKAVLKKKKDLSNVAYLKPSYEVHSNIPKMHEVSSRSPWFRLCSIDRFVYQNIVTRLWKTQQN